jgi:hypothetical protein
MQSSDFETQQVRNQTISTWRQNASQENTNNWSTSRQSQTQLFVINAVITLTNIRSSLNQFNVEEKEQNFRSKREQFQKFYDNREQSMKHMSKKKTKLKRTRINLKKKSSKTLIRQKRTIAMIKTISLCTIWTSILSKSARNATSNEKRSSQITSFIRTFVLVKTTRQR